MTVAIYNINSVHMLSYEESKLLLAIEGTDLVIGQAEQLKMRRALDKTLPSDEALLSSFQDISSDMCKLARKSKVTLTSPVPRNPSNEQLT